MIEIIVGTKTYQIGQLGTFDQLNVARKLGPAMPLIDGLVRKDNSGKDLSVLTLMALSQIDDDANAFVVGKCLSVVSLKQQDGKFAKLTTASGDLMFSDTSVAEIMKLVVSVIEENLGDFFRTALGNLDTKETV